MKSLSTFAILLICLLILSSCAPTQPHIQPCLQGHTYGFWGGLWHGIIAPFSWIGSLFSDKIAVWAVNNNGAWYNTGFVIGVGGHLCGTSRASK